MWGAKPAPSAFRALLRPAMLVYAAIHQRAPQRTIVKYIAFIATWGAPCSTAGLMTAAERQEAGSGVAAAAAVGGVYL